MAFEMSRGKVPHFSMRPHPAVTAGLIGILVVGFLLAMSFFVKEDGTGVYRHRGIVTLIIAGMLFIFLGIAATAKFWYTHLWKKNSSHARHKQHTKHHPAYQKKQYERGKRR